MPLELPNIRKLFTPSPGFTIFEADLAGADAQVVAWLTNCVKLKKIFLNHEPLHLINAKGIYGHKYPKLASLPISKLGDTIAKEDHTLNKLRQFAKVGCHAVNYGCKETTLASSLGLRVPEAIEFISNHFANYPEILAWHEQTENDLFTSRTVVNPFGYKRFYFDRLEGLLPEALAWVPQSTVAITVNKAWVNIGRNLPAVQILLQVHDSLVGQFKTPSSPDELHSILLSIAAQFNSIQIPFPNDTLTIPASIKISTKSWGDCLEYKL
jgi:DNA polymerase I-like protein with 3'-5' exonuclease and polymerase domains